MAGKISKRTENALELVNMGEMNPYAASRACGIDASTIYRALARIRNAGKKKPAKRRV